MPQIVDYVFLAEFDAERGASRLRLQYPVAAVKKGTHGESLLADAMIPEGSHLREEDWSVFFINQKTVSDNIFSTLPRQRKPADESILSKVMISAEGYSFDGHSNWSTLSRNQKVVLCLEEQFISVWDEALSRNIFNIPDNDMEYREIEHLCFCVYIKGAIFGFRCSSIEDEILLLNRFDERILSKRSFSSNLVLPPPPPSSENDDKPLLFVLNLVWQRGAGRRGSSIKALAIASRYPWAHVFKPVVSAALDMYFQSGEADLLPSLYKSINAINLSVMPRLTLVEKTILRSSSDNLMFNEKFLQREEIMNHQRQFGGGGNNGVSFTGIVDYDAVIDRHFYETRVVFNGVNDTVRIPMTTFPEEIGDFSVIKLITTFSALDSIFPPYWYVQILQQRQEQHQDQDQQQDQPPLQNLRWKAGSPFHWHPHLDSGPKTHPLIFLMNALLTQKRVIFLGDQRSAGEVAEYVLAACAMASGGGFVMRGIAERCFPYVGLVGLEALKSTPGFIAGVTNPVFEENPTWWDVLCNINTGKITLSPVIKLGPDDRDVGRDNEREWMTTGSWEGDDDFVIDLVTAIENNAGEMGARQILYGYVRRFIDSTSAYEMEIIGTTGIGLTHSNTDNPDLGVGAFFKDETSKRKELLMIKNRMEAWRKSKSYVMYQKDFQTFLRRRTLKDIDLRYQISTLKFAPSLEESTTVRIFLALQDSIVRDSDLLITEFLSLFPLNDGGLQCIASGMLHSRWEVRRAATRLLWRLDWHKVGTRFVLELNPFFRLCYSRLSRELLYVSEAEPYLDDPEFAPPPSSSVSDTTAVSESAAFLKKKAARRSMMFEAKNAGRISFVGPAGGGTATASAVGGYSDRSPPQRQKNKGDRRNYRTSVLISDDEDGDYSKAPPLPSNSKFLNRY